MSGVGDARWTLFNTEIAVDVSPLQVCPDRISFTLAWDVVPPDPPATSFSGFVVRAEDRAGVSVLGPTPVVLPANEATDTLGEPEKRAFSRGFTFEWVNELPVGHEVTVRINDPDPTDGTDHPEFTREVVPCATDVTADIDVRPGRPGNPIDPSGTDTIKVAVLTTQDHPSFDATKVRPRSVRFGRVGTEGTPVRDRLTDVDGDGDKDLVLRFRPSKTDIGCGDLSANLRGKLRGGDTFDGTDYIRTTGCP
jgi:hypothetical protein